MFVTVVIHAGNQWGFKDEVCMYAAADTMHLTKLCFNNKSGEKNRPELYFSQFISN